MYGGDTDLPHTIREHGGEVLTTCRFFGRFLQYDIGKSMYSAKGRIPPIPSDHCAGQGPISAPRVNSCVAQHSTIWTHNRPPQSNNAWLKPCSEPSQQNRNTFVGCDGNSLSLRKIGIRNANNKWDQRRCTQMQYAAAHGLFLFQRLY